MYLHYLVKMKHHISYFYNPPLECYPLHQAWCETKFIKYRENKFTDTRYVQNVHHWQEYKHARVLVIGQLHHQSATALSLAPVGRCWPICCGASVSWTCQWCHIYITCKINKKQVNSLLAGAFSPVSSYVKIIKIRQDFLDLWSQMYCHVFYELHCIESRIEN